MQQQQSSSTKKEERIQKVVFVRHGIAKHNVIDPRTGRQADPTDPSFFDPPLVYEGKQQALKAGEQLKVWWRTTQLGENVELVITSPLTRCIQTAMLGFLPGDCYTTSATTSTTSVDDEPLFLCIEQCREAYGMHYPDRRRNKSLLQKHWPIVEFDPNMSDEDVQWSLTERETMDNIASRIDKFFQILVGRSETNIVVVSHGVWIEICFHILCPQALDNGKRRVYNCDMFAADCVSIDGKFIRMDNVRQIG